MDAGRDPNAGDTPPSNGDDAYYGEHYYGCGFGIPYERSEIWMRQFGRVAQRIVEDLAPGSVLDAGCAIGLLVECLMKYEVDATGIDISSYAISRAHESIRDRCRVGSILEPFGRRYDLIVTIEVLEHMRPDQAEAAVANLCAHADDILFSSTPQDFKEPSHFNVRPPEYWAGLFAKHGFYRDLDHDATYIARWSARFRKVKVAFPRIVSDYERTLWRLLQENQGVRESLVEYEGKVARLAAIEHIGRDVDRATIRTLTEELGQARATADEANRRAIAAEAKAKASEAAERTIRADKAEADSQIEAIQKSRAWKLASGLSRVRKRVGAG